MDHYSFLHTIPLPSHSSPPQSMLLQPKHIKPDEKWDTTLNRGRGGLTFVEIQRFCGICPKTFETDCSCLSKFLCTILNQRLSKSGIDRNIIHPSQIGFQSGRRTADHIFVLKTIIDKHINQKNEKIYACFADFKKAFDSVWHEGLFLKLLENKIDGHFYNLTKSLYPNS